MSLALGFPHPDYLLEALSARQLAEWQQYYALEPFGHPIESWRAGMLASVIARPNSRKRLKASDFIPPEPETKRDKIASFKASLAHLVKRNG